MSSTPRRPGTSSANRSPGCAWPASASSSWACASSRAAEGVRCRARRQLQPNCMDESEIQTFWNRFPCGDFQVGGLERRQGDYEDFFTAYDRFRYRKEAHILRCLDEIDFKGKRVLEIGLGQGADSEQIIRRGAVWSGLDLSPESVARVQARLALRRLPHKSLKQGSVL